MGCVKFVHYAFTDHILNIKNDLFDFQTSVLYCLEISINFFK